MNRKTLIIFASVAGAAILGGIVYWYFVKRAKTPAIPADTVFPTNSGAFSGSTTSSQPPRAAYVPGTGLPPRLYELHTTPVAGVGFVETGKSSNISIAARYIERGIGNIFETNFDTFAESRISNETRLRIVESFWGNGGKGVVTRFLDDQQDGLIKTHIVNLSTPQIASKIGTSTPNQDSFLKTEEVFLPDAIPFVAVAGDNSDKLFYLQNDGSGSSGYVSSFKGLSSSKIFSTAFTEWLPQFPGQKLVTITTKASATIPGYLFFINTDTKSARKVIGDINGLTTLTSPDGKFVLYSENQGGLPFLSLYDVTKKTSYPIALETLPEKCVWSIKNRTSIYCGVPQLLQAGIYPDQWYQGLVSFSDTLWSINTVTLETKQLMSPGDYKAPGLDFVNPSVSSNDAFLVFMDKNTGTPWVYRLTDSATTIKTTSLVPAQKPTTALPAAITPDMQKIK